MRLLHGPIVKRLRFLKGCPGGRVAASPVAAQQQAEDAGPPDVAVKPSLLTLKGVEDPRLTFPRMFLALAASEADDAGRAGQTTIKGAATERIWDFTFPQVDSGQCNI
jgi:hypothetical protein